MKLNRRSALSLGTVATATAVLGSATTTAAAAPATDTTADPARRVGRVYARAVEASGGTWSSLVTVGGTTAVEAGADTVVEAYSVNKIAVATAVLDKIDRGLLTLDQRVDVTADIVIQDTDGIFALDRAYPSSITLGHAMANLLTVSDNTAVRLCGLVCPALELNEILRGKGFVHTQVVPVTNPNRFFLGQTTPRETHTLLTRLVAGELLSPTSTDYLLNVLRSTSAFVDGVRLKLTTPERLRVATKAGWFNAGRNEAGVVFTADGAAGAVYSLFAAGPFTGDATVNDTDFGATHPALQARQKLGRALFDAVEAAAPAAKRVQATPKYRPSNGG
ncbi:serine hydrolase [Actinophytocola algeriensis]|uniref:Beta-lactamase n=1 Tax=Actinophytocola algeriensis TaxID=1768010 RepID=A0A7W7Q0C6_9PSEU|nr:serine hydrolase [Actinophytocola algeriensis]MBB4904523.1 beta-lactamase class A [Actinophytocola algeriensis]MBE1476618.1 beta-lactamase class A [Actinophytocola algeriensis]